MNEIKKKEHFDRIAPSFDKWKSRNSFYHDQIRRFYASIIPRKKNILEVGCATGDLLAYLEPGYGLGIDISEKMICAARKKYPGLDLRVSDIDTLESDTRFDYIILAGLMEYIPDYWAFFRRLQKFASAETKIIITSINPLWKPAMRAASTLGLRTYDIRGNYIKRDDLVNIFLLCGFDIIGDGFRIFLPKKIFGISGFLNKIFSQMPGIKRLCSMQYAIIRSRAYTPRPQDFSCTVIVPCFNEADNIKDCIARIPRMGRFTQIIIIDDGSSDNTSGAVKENIKEENGKEILLISHPLNRGKAAAVNTGFENARGDIVIILDADMAVPPEELPQFFLAIAEGGGEFANGTRMVYPMENGAMKSLNFLGNKVFGAIMSLLTGQRITDTLCGTKAILRKYYKYIDIDSSWGDFDLLLGAAKLKLKIIEVPVHYKRRIAGNSKMKVFKDGASFLKICWRWFDELS